MTSPWRKGEKIAELVRRERTLLVLDGLEPLQHPPGAQTGRLKDPAVQALVKELAVQNAGLCVITTRQPVTDLAGRGGVVEVDLEKLPPEAGAELLSRLGCHGSKKEMRQAAKDFGGHGLALTLLGTYLRDVEDGDVRKRKEVEVLGEDVEGGAHARRVMASYAAWLGEGRELQILRLLGLFDRPAEAAALEALRALPEIAGLTEGIAADEERAWRESLARLRKARLVLPADDGTGGLDAHPLVREYFGERLRERSAEAWRAGNERLYEHYRKTAEELPETLEGLMPLYAAVAHGCRAGREQEAYDEVYRRRIHRHGEFFSQRKLGAFGADMSALASFFERAWDRPSAGLRASDRAWLLNQAGIVLRALGRLPEAAQPMRAATDLVKEQENWKDAAIGAGNLSELSLTLGEVASAVDGLRQAGAEHHLPRGLLAQSTHLRLIDSPQAALPALQEAQEIAERGHMLLHQADVHLEYARLHLQEGDPQEGDPQAARPHVARAGELIQKTGYLRRQRELAHLERQLTPG